MSDANKLTDKQKDSLILKMGRKADMGILSEGEYDFLTALFIEDDIEKSKPKWIDGKAYQFGYKGLSRLHGIYCMKTDTLCFYSGHPSVSDCTDIKPLTVEVKP